MGPAIMPVQPTASLDRPLAFAGYDLIRRLGRGGMGEVWSVVQRGPYDTPRPLAIKVLLPELSHDPIYRETFKREGKISMQLSSSNIVPVFQLGRHNGLLFMEMERVDGVNLSTFQRRSRNVHTLLPLDVVAYIIGETLGALYVAHEHVVVGRPAGVLHRDVKPGNILISSTGDVRLIDFGIARPLTGVAATQLPIGTWRYMAPEQAAGRAQRASDLFSVGVLFQELLTGEPFRECGLTTAQYYRMAIEYDEIPTLGVIPQELERLRRGLLEPVADQRFQSAADAMHCLSEWPGFRYAKLKLARIYEMTIGTRSSGFTNAHEAVPPSFLFHKDAGLVSVDESGTDATTVFFQRPYAGAGPSLADDDVDEDTKTMLRRPWLRRAQWMSKHGVPPEQVTKTPSILARPRDGAIGPHPVAVAPPPSRTSRAMDEGLTEARAITPTLRLVTPMTGDAPSKDIGEQTDLLRIDLDRDAPCQSASVSDSSQASDRPSSGRTSSAKASAVSSGAQPGPHGSSPLLGARKARLPTLAIVALAALATVSASWAIHSGCSSTTEVSP